MRHFRPCLLILGAAACAPAVTPPSAAGPLYSPDAPLTSTPDPDVLLAAMSLHDRAAQLVMPWLAGTYAAFDDSAFMTARRWVDSLHVGGIIISVGSPLDEAAKLNRLQQGSWVPLLIASDLEAGTAIRFRGGTAFPTNMGVAATGRDRDAYEMGRVTALEGRAVGVHLAFAPVADVNNNPANPIINTRSFGEDPARVARLVAEEVRGMREHGMMATAKHFPGHGDTGTDSHIALPVITVPWSRLDTLELVPFRAAIDAGVDAVMSAHIALPGLEHGETVPATLSPEILTGILRDSLDFHGLIVTDALDMGALVATYGPGEAAVRALIAGADLLLQPSDPAAAIDAVTEAVRSGRVSEARLNASVRRLLAIKAHLGLYTHRGVPLDSIPLVVGSAEFQELARDITRRSIVLAKDSGGVVDRMRAGPGRIAVVALGDDVGAVLAARLRARGDTVRLFRLYPASGPASYDSARAVLDSAGAAIFATSVRASAWSGTIDLPLEVAALVDSTALRTPTVLLSFGSPYVIRQAPGAWAYLLGWAGRPESERAMADALTGATPITGRLPASIPPLFPVGTGIQKAAP